MTTTTTPASFTYNIPDVNSGTTTSWIPLTTAWPSQSGCASSFFLYPGQPAPVAWDPGYGYFYGGTPRCLPPAATTWWEQDHQNPDGFTSLSIRPIMCPAAFTTAATSVEGSSTQVMCCPSGYNVENGEPGRVVGECLSPLTSGQTITYLASFASGVNTTTLAISTSTKIRAIAVMGWNIAETTSSSGTSSSPTSGSTSTSTSTSESCRSGLSAGAKGGIGVSAAIGAIGILSLIAAFFLLRRRPRAAEHPHSYSFVPPSQMDSSPVHEIGTHKPAAELPSTR